MIAMCCQPVLCSSLGVGRLRDRGRDTASRSSMAHLQHLSVLAILDARKGLQRFDGAPSWRILPRAMISIDKRDEYAHSSIPQPSRQHIHALSGARWYSGRRRDATSCRGRRAGWLVEMRPYFLSGLATVVGAW